MLQREIQGKISIRKTPPLSHLAFPTPTSTAIITTTASRYHNSIMKSYVILFLCTLASLAQHVTSDSLLDPYTLNHSRDLLSCPTLSKRAEEEKASEVRGERKEGEGAERNLEGGERKVEGPGGGKEGGEKKNEGGSEGRVTSDGGERKPEGGERNEGGEKRVGGGESREGGERKAEGAGEIKEGGEKKNEGAREGKRKAEGGEAREGGEKKVGSEAKEGGERGIESGERKAEGERKEGGGKKAEGGEGRKTQEGGEGREAGEKRVGGEQRERSEKSVGEERPGLPLILREDFTFPAQAISRFSQQLGIRESICRTVISDISVGASVQQIQRERGVTPDVIGSLAFTCSRFVPLNQPLHFAFSNAVASVTERNQIERGNSVGGLEWRNGGIWWNGRVIVDGPFVNDISRQVCLQQPVCGQVIRDIGGLRVGSNVIGSAQILARRYGIRPAHVVQIASLCSPRFSRFQQFYPRFNSISRLRSRFPWTNNLNCRIGNGGQVISGGSQIFTGGQISGNGRTIFSSGRGSNNPIIIVQEGIQPRVRYFSSRLSIPYNRGSDCITRILNQIQSYGFNRLAEPNNTDTQNMLMDIISEITLQNETLSKATPQELPNLIQQVALKFDAPIQSIPKISKNVAETMVEEKVASGPVYLSFKAISDLITGPAKDAEAGMNLNRVASNPSSASGTGNATKYMPSAAKNATPSAADEAMNASSALRVCTSMASAAFVLVVLI
ncbi:hypothetical protein BJ741DRAFT_49290 [Chytriomyces cf. hyalinus JEL632]|nr:hypothetical protein BJ741DRAFT_49290 [Chytriomyces cf. hyalinus JEL632]